MTNLSAATPVAFIHTVDRDRALKFYVEVLGFALRSSDPFGDFLDAGPARVRMSVVPDHNALPHTIFGWDVADIAETVKSLRERGASFIIYDGMGQDPSGIWTSPGGSQVAWFNDPDGNVLSLSQT